MKVSVSLFFELDIQWGFYYAQRFQVFMKLAAHHIIVLIGLLMSLPDIQTSAWCARM
jgi:hypothetical protein